MQLYTQSLIARAGGGGSSSGDGGGELLVLIGYVPMHIICRSLRKHTYNSDIWIIAQVVGWFICIMYALLLIFIFRGFGFAMAAGSVLGSGAGLYGWFSLLKRTKKTTENLKLAASNDPIWNEQDILTRAKDVFLAYQMDWSARNYHGMGGYMTPRYVRHAALMVAALTQVKRLNKIKVPVIKEAVITDMRDSIYDSEDTVTVGFTASANDKLIDELNGKVLYTDNSAFTEFWRFKRDGSKWMLDGIQQATQSGWRKNPILEQFAENNGYFYSSDWGWLFIPKRGELFAASKFGSSDINNHIIGIYNGLYLLQLYTYVPNIGSSGGYLIAQTNVPKDYGEIVVKRKKIRNKFLSFKGLKKIELESSDFNRTFDVYASDAEKITSFELLHPAYMEKLMAAPFEVNIQVVDNFVYLYTQEKPQMADVTHYAVLLELLREAYKQMKL